MSVAGFIVDYLETRRVPCALVGGAALAVHGIARATLDVDFLVIDPRVTEPRFWEGLTGLGPPEIRRGDEDDPLAGLVRWRLGEAALDLVVGRGAWLEGVLSRRLWLDLGGEKIPVVTPPDLILLKLAAGGPQDLLDARILLTRDDGSWRRAIEARLPSIGPEALDAWRRLPD